MGVLIAASPTHIDSQLPGGAAQLILPFPVAASEIIYQGAYVALSGGYVAAWSGTGVKLGIARDTVDNSAGSAGDLSVQVGITPMRFDSIAVAGTILVTSSGAEVYCATDDLDDLTITAGSNESIGRIVGNIDATAGTAGVVLYGMFTPGASDFDSAVKMNSTLAVTGAVTFSSTLAVTGLSTLTGGVTAADLALNSTNELNITFGNIAGLAIDDAAITGHAAAADAAGIGIYIQTADAGATPTTAKAGGLLDIRTGDGAAALTTVAGGAGGAINIQSGAGGIQSAGAAVSGAGGAITMTTGAGAAQTFAGASGAGGAGGNYTVTLGVGGATADTGSENGGAAGDYTITGAVGGLCSGAGTGDGGTGSAISGTAGPGGATIGGTAGAGGPISWTGGAGAALAAAIAAGIGGTATLASGAGGAATGTAAGGASGATTITVGAAGAHTGGGATGAGGAAGAISILGVAGGATSNVGTDNGGAGSDISVTAGAGGAASAGTGDGGAGGSVTLTSGAGGTSAGATAGVAGVVMLHGPVAREFTVTAYTTTTTITVAAIRGGMITGNQGGTAAATYTTPTGTQISTEFPDLAVGDAIDLTVTNISTDGAEDVTMAGGADVTDIGAMVVASNAAATDKSAGIFRLLKTAATTFDFYRIS